MITNSAPAVLSLPSRLASADSVDVEVNYTFFPFVSAMRDAVGGTMGLVLILLVAVIVLGALAWGASKLMGSGRGQSISGVVVIVAVVAAVIVGAAGGIVDWASAINTGF
ncbi:MAG TPA: hypothetical protein VGC67_11780 [Cellulomonas sp.]